MYDHRRITSLFFGGTLFLSSLLVVAGCVVEQGVPEEEVLPASAAPGTSLDAYEASLLPAFTRGEVSFCQMAHARLPQAKRIAPEEFDLAQARTLSDLQLLRSGELRAAHLLTAELVHATPSDEILVRRLEDGQISIEGAALKSGGAPLRRIMAPERGLRLVVEGASRVIIDESLDAAGLSEIHVVTGEGTHEIDVRASAPCVVVDPGGDAIQGPVQIKLSGNIEQSVMGCTGGDDVLAGSPGNDIISGCEGSDIICGRGGDDTLYGNTGRDTLYGQPGNDSLYGNEQDDCLFGGQDNDTLYGGQDNDGLDGNLGQDSCYGNLGAQNLCSINCEYVENCIIVNSIVPPCSSTPPGECAL